MININGVDIYNSTENNLGFVNLIKTICFKRELLMQLLLGDLRSRYRRSVLGLFWTLVNPIISSLVLWVVFVSIFKSNLLNGTQFAPYLMAGVLTITFFNQGLMQAAESVSNGARLFLKIKADPRLFCISNSLSNAVNFFLGILALIFVSWLTGSKVSLKLPLVVLVGFCLTILIIGLGLSLSILFIRFDDARNIMTIILQLLTYLTPVFYPKEMLSPNLQFLISLNPLTSCLDVLRNVANGTEIATRFDWYYMFGFSIFTFAMGVMVFKKFWSKTVIML